LTLRLCFARGISFTLLVSHSPVALIQQLNISQQSNPYSTYLVGKHDGQSSLIDSQDVICNTFLSHGMGRGTFKSQKNHVL
jgi:hypothetical protein